MPHRELLHQRDGDEVPVDFAELFFDLVFVFGIAQISHRLLADLTAPGLLRTLILLAALWWIWICTTWVTNWLDAERGAVRFLLFALMVVGLLLSSSVPQAFGDRGFAFASAYVSFHLLRTIFAIWACRHDRALRQNFVRAAIWFSGVGPLWIAGGLADESVRFGLWGLAICLDLLAAAARFWVPGLGATPLGHWNIEGNHIAHRCGLFIIIVLGEMILVSGAMFMQGPWYPIAILAFLNAVVAVMVLWWLYFGQPNSLAHQRLTAGPRVAWLALVAYGFLPILFIAGIVLNAVGSHLTLTHPLETPAIFARTILLGGVAIYLAGAVLLARLMLGKWKPYRIVALAAVCLLAILGLGLSSLALSMLVTAILLALVFAEYRLWRGLSDDERRQLAGAGSSLGRASSKTD